MSGVPVSDAIGSIRYSPFSAYNSVMQLSALRCIIIGKCQRQKCKLQSVTKARPSSEDRQKGTLAGLCTLTRYHTSAARPSVALIPATVAARSITYTHSSEHAVWFAAKIGSHNP